MQAPQQVDALHAEFLREPLTIGEALRSIEDLVSSSIAWARSSSDSTQCDDDIEKALNEWYGRCQNELARIFTSDAPRLLFVSSRSDLPLSGKRAQLTMCHRHLSRGLLRIRDRLLDDRERISGAAYDLATRLAERDEILRLMRDSNTMTEDLWLRAIGDPIVKPPISRLLDLGVAKEIVLEMLKQGAALGVAALVK